MLFLFHYPYTTILENYPELFLGIIILFYFLFQVFAIKNNINYSLFNIPTVNHNMNIKYNINLQFYTYYLSFYYQI